MVEYLKDTGNRFRNLKKDRIAFKNILLKMDNARLHSAERTFLEQNGVQIDPQCPYNPDLNLCDRSSSPGCKNTAGQKNTATEKSCILYIDAKRYLRSLPEDLLLHELNKHLEHCRAVIREAGAYVTN